jgi:hypothetical protein
MLWNHWINFMWGIEYKISVCKINLYPFGVLFCAVSVNFMNIIIPVLYLLLIIWLHNRFMCIYCKQTSQNEKNIHQPQSLYKIILILLL